MNIQEADILRTLFRESFKSQRILSEVTGHSLGVVNQSMKQLIREGYLDTAAELTVKAKDIFG